MTLDFPSKLKNVLEPPIYDLNGYPGSLKIRNFKPDQLAGSDRCTLVGKYGILTKNVDKTLKFRKKGAKKYIFC